MGFGKLFRTVFQMLIAVMLLSPCLLSADSINVAVASNFVKTMEEIKKAFEEDSEHDIQIIRGSSGKHYAQIRNGAPFDVFLSADQQRPRNLVDEGYALSGSLKTYALGRLVLWTANEQSPPMGKQYLLNTDSYQRIAIANPRLAPYGQAAMELIAALQLEKSLAGKLVMGENVSQTFQFVFSRNADAGLVAYSQVLSPTVSGVGSYWLIPDSYYQAIRQDMVVLIDSSASRGFARFMHSDRVAAILLGSGYLLPEHEL